MARFYLLDHAPAGASWIEASAIGHIFYDVDRMLDANWIEIGELSFLEYRARITLMLSLISEAVHKTGIRDEINNSYPGAPKLIADCRNAVAHPLSTLHDVKGGRSSWNTDGRTFNWGVHVLDIPGVLLPVYEAARRILAERGFAVGQEAPAKKYLRHFDRDGNVLRQDLMLEGSLKAILEHPPHPVFPDCAEIVTYDGREYAADELPALRNQQGL